MKYYWDVYIARWRTGHYSIYILCEDIDWADELDAEGDPAYAEVRRIPPGNKQAFSIQQPKADFPFDVEVTGKNESMADLFEASSDVVWTVSDSEQNAVGNEGHRSVD